MNPIHTWDEPTIDLINLKEAILREHYKFTLIGKFCYRKPIMRKISENFQKLGFHDRFELGLSDTLHILIHLTHEEDYIRLFLKTSWYIDGCPIRVLKWTCDFDLNMICLLLQFRSNFFITYSYV